MTQRDKHTDNQSRRNKDAQTGRDTQTGETKTKEKRDSERGI